MKERIPKVTDGISLYQTRPTNLFNHNLMTQIIDARGGMGIEGDGFLTRSGASPERLSTILSKHRSTEATDLRDT